MHNAIQENITDRLLPAFRKLTAEHQPLWGSMSPQHMVEHIVGSWRISNGRTRLPLSVSPEDSARRKQSLMQPEPYARNIMNPVFRNGLPPLRKPDLPSAIAQLEDEVAEFFRYHSTNPGSVENHPVYGPMDVSEWMHFQQKHMEHHLRQFGML